MNRVLLLIVTTLLLCSCVERDDFQLRDVSEVKIKATTMRSILISTDIDIYSDAPTAASIKKLEVTLYYNGKYFAKLSLTDKVKVKRGLNKSLPLPIRIEFNNMFGPLKISKLNQEGITLDVEALFTAPLYRKTIELEEVAITELIHNDNAKLLLEGIDNILQQ